MYRVSHHKNHHLSLGDGFLLVFLTRQRSSALVQYRAMHVDKKHALPRGARREDTMLNVWRTLLVGGIPVDYTLSLEEAIAKGHYNRVHPELTAANFPSRRSASEDITITILFFENSDDGCADTFEIRRWFDCQGYLAGGVCELLALGAKRPDYQLRSQIVALDEVWLNPEDDKCYAPILTCCTVSGVGRREVDMADVNIGWTKNVGFVTYAKQLRKGVG